MDYGCTFKGKHSYKDYKLIMRSVDRSLLPGNKISQVNISFLDGKQDLRKEPIYDNRMVSVEFVYLSMDTEYIHARKRLIAGWLSGQGQLIFDDEADKYYNAKVYDGLSLNQEIGKASFTVNFECEPFALKTPILQTESITTQNQEVIVNIEGNIKTGSLITLTNIGSTTINRIELARERSKDL